MHLKSSIAFTLLAAAGAAAPAGVFTWTAGDGSWDNHANWAGPGGQVPHLIVDSATIGVDSADVLIESSIALGWMRVHNGAEVFTYTGSLFVNGDVIVEDGGSALVVADGPGLRDFDADTVTVRDTYMVMSDGTAQIDEALLLDHAALSGKGVVEMNSTTGDLDLNSSSLWAWGSGMSETRTLTVRRTDSSTSVLDWSDPDCNVLAWYDSTLDVQIPVSGALGGELYVSTSCMIRIADPVIAGASSRTVLWGGESYDNDEAVLEAPVFDSYGALFVSGDDSIIRAPFIALRGTGSFDENTDLVLESTSVIFDSFDASANGGEGGNIRFDGTQTLTVNGGTTTVSTGQFGLFDLDGPGDMTVNIADGSALVLDLHHIEVFQTDDFDGTMNIDGSFHLASYAGGEQWTNRGEINLDAGEITGRTLENEGTITGSGSIENLASTDGGEIIADSGTLVIEHADNGHLRGLVRAETGDLRVDTVGNYDMIQVIGDLFVGDGQAIPEVAESNNSLSVTGGGSLSMDAGFVRAKNVSVHSAFSAQGDSTLRTTGNGFFDHGVSFFPTGASTISDTLEIDGGGRAYAGHTFQGEGLIRASKVSEDFDFGHGADTGDVSFASAGMVTVNDHNSGIGQASVAGFELEPTSTFKIDVGGPNQGTDHDAISALDAAVIDGTLVIGTVGGYAPIIGQTITVLSAPSISGEFDTVDDSALDWTRRAEVSVEPDRVDVTFFCAADLNGDGLLDLSDITLFTQAFTADDMAADLYAPEGVLDLADVLAFIEMFNNGCN